MTQQEHGAQSRESHLDVPTIGIQDASGYGHGGEWRIIGTGDREP